MSSTEARQAVKTIVIYWLRGFIASEATKDALADRPSRNKLEEYIQLIVYTAVNRSKYPPLQILATTSRESLAAWAIERSCIDYNNTKL